MIRNYQSALASTIGKTSMQDPCLRGDIRSQDMELLFNLAEDKVIEFLRFKDSQELFEDSKVILKGSIFEERGDLQLQMQRGIVVGAKDKMGNRGQGLAQFDRKDRVGEPGAQETDEFGAQVERQAKEGNGKEANNTRLEQLGIGIADIFED